jgi:DNA-binding NarL/FixJ family response regulator
VSPPADFARGAYQPVPRNRHDVRVTIRALVADDSDDTRELIKASLLGFGDFEIVGEARDGAEAVALAQETEPDVVILDLAMPVMDGLAALPEIRRLSPNSRVVVFSAFNREDLRADAARLGADAYGVKGIDPRALVALIEKSVAGARGRVLLAEAPTEGSGAYTAALERAGYQVTAAKTVGETLEMVKHRNFDLVLVDLRLPGGDALDLLRHRGAQSAAVLPVVVMLGAREDPAAIDAAFRLGAEACMSRAAVSPEELPQRVEAWLEQGPNFRAV